MAPYREAEFGGILPMSLVKCGSMSGRFAKFIADFRESTKTSRRTDWLLSLALLFYSPMSVGIHVADWLAMISLIGGSGFTVAFIVSLAIDNRRLHQH
jgi:hypothetical protein